MSAALIAVLAPAGAAAVTLIVLVVVSIFRARMPYLADVAVVVVCVGLLTLGLVLLTAPDILPGVMTPGPYGPPTAWETRP